MPLLLAIEHIRVNAVPVSPMDQVVRSSVQTEGLTELDRFRDIGAPAVV
jgi:hypothetical protein